MITIFNRKRLITVASIADQAKIREILSAEHIDYYIKTDSRLGEWRGRRPTFNSNYQCDYTFFVLKSQYSAALKALQR